MIGTRSQKSSGFTLTEIAIVLGITGSVLGAIWVAASGVYQNLRLSKATTELTQVAQSTKSFFTPQASTGDGSQELTQTLYIVKLIPADMFDPSATASNPSTIIAHAPWSGSTMKIFSDTHVTAGDAFQILFVNIPPSACIGLITGNTGPSRDSGMTGVGVNPTSSGTAVSASAMNSVFPVTAPAAATACGDANSDVGFQFALQ